MQTDNIGFLLSHMRSSQIAYECLYNANQFAAENPNKAVSIFVRELSPPCIKPECSVYSIHPINFFRGHLVLTDLKGVEETNDCVLLGRYYYIYDPIWIRNGFNFRTKDFYETMLNPNIKKVFRSDDLYNKAMEDLGVDIEKCVVESFNINDFMEIFNATA